MDTQERHRIPDTYEVAGVWFVGFNKIMFDLTDGRVIGAPLRWFPRLYNATGLQRANWKIMPDLSGVHWPDVDEDISIRVLLGQAS